MKFEATTTQVLKNFASINNSIQFKQGNRLATISPTKTVMARATLEQEIPGNFAIYDLSRLLGILSMFENPEIELKDTFAVINNEFDYTFTDPSLIVTPPEKEINLSDPEVQFKLQEATLNRVMKALSAASLPELAVSGRDGKIYLEALDTKGSTRDRFSVEVGETGSEFRMVFRAENIKLMGGDYDVAISSKGLSHFKGEKVEYWIAVESNSEYKG